jgi:hypothetical protein
MSRESVKQASKHPAQTETERLIEAYKGASATTLKYATRAYGKRFASTFAMTRGGLSNSDYWSARYQEVAKGMELFLKHQLGAQ